jgi:hypothetical protein
VRSVRIRPAAISTTAKVSEAATTRRWRTYGRRAAHREPVSEPTARNVPSRPYSVAPFPKTWVAIRAEVIWKLRPKVPVKNTIARISSRSGRFLT